LTRLRALQAIGLHIASLAIGSELGLIDKDEAAAKFEKVLDTMEKIHFNQDGFFPNFINRDLSTKFNSVMRADHQVPRVDQVG
jgi:hypothetical protein